MVHIFWIIYNIFEENPLFSEKNEWISAEDLPQDATAKSPDQKFWMDCKKDKIWNFERGYLQSNHRKVTDFGLLQDFKKMIMTFDNRIKIPLPTRFWRRIA